MNYIMILDTNYIGQYANIIITKMTNKITEYISKFVELTQEEKEVFSSCFKEVKTALMLQIGHANPNPNRLHIVHILINYRFSFKQRLL